MNSVNNLREEHKMMYLSYLVKIAAGVAARHNTAVEIADIAERILIELMRRSGADWTKKLVENHEKIN